MNTNSIAKKPTPTAIVCCKDRQLFLPLDGAGITLTGKATDDCYLLEGLNLLSLGLVLQNGKLLWHSDDGKKIKQGTIGPALTKTIGNAKVSFYPAAEFDDKSNPSLIAGGEQSILARMLRACGTPGSQSALLDTQLKSLLQIVTNECGAIFSSLLLCSKDGDRLIANDGISLEVVSKQLSHVPQSYKRSILQKNARVILPENFENTGNVDTTVFFAGLHGLAGFPVTVDNRVLGILFISFKNLVADFDEELQSSLEAAAVFLSYVLQEKALTEQLHIKTTQTTQPNTLARAIIGQSAAIESLYLNINKLAPTKLPVLVLGATGVGKELVAKELHRLSNRSKQPFIAVNAAALPENLIESELFGHKKGAFTGAMTDRRGLIEQAEGGTLFIDEIGELPLSAQAKILRALQEKIVQRVGDSLERRVDFRLVTATHCDLENLSTTGQFRQDLFFRISGCIIKIPPLRERQKDIMLLANYFARQFAESHQMAARSFSHQASLALCQYAWPGNVRELKNVVERAQVMAEESVINAEDLNLATLRDQQTQKPFRAGATPNPLSLAEAKDNFLRETILKTLEENDGNKKKSAECLGVGRRTLFRYLEQLGIE